VAAIFSGIFFGINGTVPSDWKQIFIDENIIMVSVCLIGCKVETDDVNWCFTNTQPQQSQVSWNFFALVIELYLWVIQKWSVGLIWTEIR